MQLFKKIPFFLFLLLVFFCLHGSVENYGYLDVQEVLWVALAIIIGITLLFAFIWFITKDLLLASLVSFFISSWYLFFGALHDLIKAASFLHFLRSYTVLLPVLLLLNVLVIWWLKRSKPLHGKLMLYLNVLFMVFCMADIFMLVNKIVNYKETAITNPVPFDASKVIQKPNVYFLLFDEYAGYKSLQDSFEFKNDSLYTMLQQQQFRELPVFSNYDFTPFSISSIVNMNYVPENYNKQLLTQPDVQHRFGEIRNGQVFNAFKAMGYDIANYSIFDIKGKPALSQSNGLFPIHAALLTNKIFHKRLLKDIGWWFVTGKFQLPFLKKTVLYHDDEYNKQVEEKLTELASAKTSKPRFCYAHFFLPHGQYFRDSSGAFNTPAQMSDLANKSLYISYLKYTNQVIKKLVSHISTRDPNAIVILMSDHGFYDYLGTGGYHSFNYNNICFLRSPAAADAGNLPHSN
ncbi:MAG: sulfatase-like hydrolase/transferase, partial [Ferruginibacter sp.]